VGLNPYGAAIKTYKFSDGKITIGVGVDFFGKIWGVNRGTRSGFFLQHRQMELPKAFQPSGKPLCLLFLEPRSLALHPAPRLGAPLFRRKLSAIESALTSYYSRAPR